MAVNGTLSYLASDLLGSATVALDGSGTPTASQLYAPYGGIRYSNGTMPTDYGFTGQHSDASTGLDYYGARYYDPTLGQFTSADTVLNGLNRYGYVGGNPISYTDPSGHLVADFIQEIADGAEPGKGPTSVTSDVGNPSGGDGTGGGPSLGNPDITLWQDFEVYGGFLGYTKLESDGLIHYIYTGDIPYDGDLSTVWNQRTAPRSGPRSSPNLTATRETKPTGGSGGSTPQTQTGGGSAGGTFGGDDGAAPASPGDDGCGCGGQQSKRIALYRAVGINELNDVLKYGDYGIDPSAQGKDFAFTEEGARTFAKTGLNVGRRMTITRITVPEDLVTPPGPGQPFFDSGGAGPSVQFGFDNGAMFKLYDAMSPIEILDASWVRSIGC